MRGDMSYVKEIGWPSPIDLMDQPKIEPQEAEPTAPQQNLTPGKGLLFQDARNYQILFLALFLIVGISTRDWSLRPEVIATAIATCFLVQWGLSVQGLIFELIFRPESTRQTSTELTPQPPQLFNWRSPLITALGLSILLRVDHWQTMALAATVAIASKFWLRFEGKHFFNPSNIGIIAVLWFAPDAWVSPGQWGEDMWYALMFLGAGGIVLKKVGRFDTTATFLGTYALLEAGRNVWLGWTWDVWLHRLSSGSLLMFSLFMITDPRSIPNARSGRLVFAAAIALLTYILRNHFYLSTAVFWALFILSPLTLLLDRIWVDDRFVWNPLKNSEFGIRNSEFCFWRGSVNQ
jgi:Na+-transporting NADH:ubiquinone oxidoreductase subunit NqrB